MTQKDKKMRFRKTRELDEDGFNMILITSVILILFQIAMNFIPDSFLNLERWLTQLLVLGIWLFIYLLIYFVQSEVYWEEIK